MMLTWPRLNEEKTKNLSYTAHEDESFWISCPIAAANKNLTMLSMNNLDYNQGYICKHMNENIIWIRNQNVIKVHQTFFVFSGKDGITFWKIIK